MGMGTSACFAEHVKDETVRKVVGDELYDSFAKALKAAEGTDGFCHGEGDLEFFEYDPDLDEVKAFLGYTKDIEAKFKTLTGITIQLCYHDKTDTGDRYDDVDGWYWDADFRDLYKPTQELLDIRGKYGNEAIERAFYTVFG